ncbi:MAG: NUDIX domain-containing protein [Candidatus Binatia bacterium]
MNYSKMKSVIRVSAGVLTRGPQLLICQRRAYDPHALKWEFPGGKAHEGEDDLSCLRRELREELRIEATLGDVLYRATHRYPNGRTVALTFFHVVAYAGEIENTQFQALVWIAPAQLPAYDFLEGDLAFVSALTRGEWSHLFHTPRPAPHRPRC